MLVNDICERANVRQNRKRVGRGIGSGCGKTCGRGHKGAGSRSGNSSRLAFEGGQTAIFRRVAKRGQSRRNGYIYAKVISLSQLSQVFKSGEVIDSSALLAKSFISRLDQPYKILGACDHPIPLNLRVSSISRGAVQVVKTSGGSVELV